LKEEKETAIFDAALKVITERGFHRARMSDIAAKAGISYGLVYHYFRNKEDLFDAILRRWWDRLFALLRDVKGRETDVKGRLKAIIIYFLDTYQRQPELVSIFITEISRSTANLTPERLERFKEFISMTESVIEAGQRERILRQDFKARYLSTIFLGALETFVSTMVLANQRIRGNAQKERIAESILEVFINGARSPAGDQQLNRP
jgi:AcrR family transcriptional regulator